MTRVNMQKNLENAVENARLTVKASKGLRDAVRVGVYQVGKRIFAVVDAATGYEVKGSTLNTLSHEEYSKYIRPEYILDASYLFKDIPTDTLNTLTKLFEEVSKQ